MMFDEIKSAFIENKLAIYVAITVFFISMILGYVFEPNLYSYFNPVVEDLTQKVQSGTVKLTFADIFFNNIKIVFQMFIYGVVFCFSIFLLAFNGFFTGYYVAISGNLFYTLLLIIPHAIFEFSSCILACASGLVLFRFMHGFLKSIWHQDEKSAKLILWDSFNENSTRLKQAVIIFIMASVLMAIAGFVETYLTIPIAKAIISVLS